MTIEYGVPRIRAEFAPGIHRIRGADSRELSQCWSDLWYTDLKGEGSSLLPSRTVWAFCGHLLCFVMKNPATGRLGIVGYDDAGRGNGRLGIEVSPVFFGDYELAPAGIDERLVKEIVR